MDSTNCPLVIHDLMPDIIAENMAAAVTAMRTMNAVAELVAMGVKFFAFPSCFSPSQKE